MGRERNAALARHFGENLRACRQKVCLSQEELSCRAGLHRAEVGLLERGLRVPSIETVIKLAAGAEVSIDQLVVGIDWVPSFEPGKGAFLFHSPLDPSMLWRIGGEDVVRDGTNDGGRG